MPWISGGGTRWLTENDILCMTESQITNDTGVVCIKVSMPPHQVLPLTEYIFQASYSTSAMQANKIQSTDQSELLNP